MLISDNDCDVDEGQLYNKVLLQLLFLQCLHCCVFIILCGNVYGFGLLVCVLYINLNLMLLTHRFVMGKNKEQITSSGSDHGISLVFPVYQSPLQQSNNSSIHKTRKT